MITEAQLGIWTGPSSQTEQDKQDRTERMIREAIHAHPAFEGVGLKVFAKGSYANNTNVKADSDVDVAVECTEALYWKETTEGLRPLPHNPYRGQWTPDRLRAELLTALKTKFPDGVDASGSTAFRILPGSSRVNADVVPCFSFKYYTDTTTWLEGTKVFKKDGSSLQNYPNQQLTNGRAKNIRTGSRYKKIVRILKRVENAMVQAGVHREVPSFFVECLVYNCPDELLTQETWTDSVQGALSHLWVQLKGDEPTESSQRLVEVNECKYLFSSEQAWTRQDGRDFVQAAWEYVS